MASAQVKRTAFNGDLAEGLAAQVGVPKRLAGPHPNRFAFFADGDRLVVVAGKQEEAAVQRALVYGLSLRAGRRLTLLLPESYSEATEQRVPWLRPDARPEIYLHNENAVTPLALRTREATIAALTDRLEGTSPARDLRDATAPLHLGDRSGGVDDLVEWATRHSFLDSAHRRQERSWHCFGQRVLSIRSLKDGLEIRAGIHSTIDDEAPLMIDLPAGESLSEAQVLDLEDAAEEALLTRIKGARCQPDEHWLQSVIRSDPGLVGVEQPALREVPAFRPVDKPSRWGRGFVDIIGLDGHGDVRVVETKLASNADDLFTFQGLDYWMWAQAYEVPLRERLGAPVGARFVLHYVVGATLAGHDRMSTHAEAVAAALDADVRAQVVHDWFSPPTMAPVSAPYEFS